MKSSPRLVTVVLVHGARADGYCFSHGWVQPPTEAMFQVPITILLP